MACVITTDPPEKITDIRWILNAHRSAECASYIGCSFDYYWEGGPIYNRGIITAPNPWYDDAYYPRYNIFADRQYYYRGHIVLKYPPYTVFVGNWVGFYTGTINEIHFRAYGVDPKGNVIYGEDMSFEY